MLDEDESPAETTSGTTSGTGHTPGGRMEEFEALACVACRSRKLKCDRAKPACARCLKLKVDCTYPESRRKPASKRRNVADLEERLAHVEVLLKSAADKIASGAATETGPEPQAAPRAHSGNAPRSNARSGSDPNPSAATFPSFGNDANGSLHWGLGAEGTTATPLSHSGVPFDMPDPDYQPRVEAAGATSYELLGLGLFEALPPTEMIEELHQAYFTAQHPIIPILHPGRYMQAFYSAPHLRPPMALQYAVWTMATLGLEKYSHYHNAFHRRCRHYLEEDELKGDGEHFLTVSHAQAWALTATAEARNMWFTRAAMSTSRCIKLLHMMGLHRLDDPNAEFEMMPTILPPKDWLELEERRRVFWAAFASDSHASISTGWPTLIDPNEVTTHLPSSEEAFNQGREEMTSRLHEAFTGSTYSSFAATAVVCHVFNSIMKHANRSQPGDCPQDFEYGKYWNRHRDLDNIISGAFMFLPARFRLPHHARDPIAVHTNLNLHAATICLHNSAYEMANEHNLSDDLKNIIKARLMSASNEVVNIVKLASHANIGFRSPYVALALYVASSCYISQSQEDGPTPVYTANIQFLFTAMEALGKQHRITLNFLRQAAFELQEAGLDYAIRMPKIPPPPGMTGPVDTSSPCSQIPLFARSRISKRTAGILPPLPGRLPLAKPMGRRGQQPQANLKEFEIIDLNPLFPAGAQRQARAPSTADQDMSNANKRRRVNLSPEPSSMQSGVETLPWSQNGPMEEILSSAHSTPEESSLSSATLKNPETSMNLPHRAGGSSTSGSPSGAINGSSTTTPGSIATSSRHTAGVDGVFGATAGAAAAAGAQQASGGAVLDMDMFQGLNGWDAVQDRVAQGQSAAVYAEVAAAMMSDDNWMMLNDVGGNGQPWGTGTGGAGVG